MKKKKVLKIMLITLLVLAILMSAGYLYLYNHGMSGKMLDVEAPAEGQIKVACVGDSITYGHGISDWSKNNYPVLLQGKLGDNYHVQSFGVSGRAVQPGSDQPYTALEHYQQSLAYDADIVVFMMGSNDAKPENWFGADAFKSELLTLLDSYGDTKLYLCTPATAFYLDGKTTGPAEYDIQPPVVTEIAQIIRDISAERGYTLIDINAMTADHAEWFAKDGIHPDNDGAAAIAEAVHQAIVQELSKEE